MGKLRMPLAAGALVLTLAVAVGCAPVAPASPGGQRSSIPPGVRVAGAAVGGMTAADAARLVQGLAGSFARPAQNAYVDANTHGLVPGVDGVEVDVAATVGRALAAPRGADLTPVLRPVPPSVSLGGLPAAPVYNGSRQRRAVAFVINVAWGDEYIPGMLKTIAAEKAPVTWCLVGRWAETHPDLVREMVTTARSADIAVTFCNHGYRDHGWALLDQQQALESITSADGAIAALTGETPRYFSPHRGEFNPAVLAASRQADHELVLWSLDTVDWKNPAASTMRMRIVNRAKPGDIVLMHPTAPTAQALAAMIEGVRGKGLALVTLDQLLSPERGPWDAAAG